MSPLTIETGVFEPDTEVDVYAYLARRDGVAPAGEPVASGTVEAVDDVAAVTFDHLPGDTRELLLHAVIDGRDRYEYVRNPAFWKVVSDPLTIATDVFEVETEVEVFAHLARHDGEAPGGEPVASGTVEAGADGPVVVFDELPETESLQVLLLHAVVDGEHRYEYVRNPAWSR